MSEFEPCESCGQPKHAARDVLRLSAQIARLDELAHEFKEGLSGLRGKFVNIDETISNTNVYMDPYYDWHDKQ